MGQTTARGVRREPQEPRRRGGRRPAMLAVLVNAALLATACGGGTTSMPAGGSGTAQTPRPLDADAWRVVADGPGGGPGVVRSPQHITAAADPDDLAVQWEVFGADGTPEAIEDGEVAILLAYGESGTCPENVTEVAVDEQDGDVVVRREVDAGPDQGCTDDFNPRTVVLAVDADALPNAPFRLGALAAQRPHWEGVAPHGSPSPPADHPHRGLGYGQSSPVARLHASTPQVPRGDVGEVIGMAVPSEGDPAVGDGTRPDPHDEVAREHRDGADEPHAPQPMAPATLERWDGHRWVPLANGAGEGQAPGPSAAPDDEAPGPSSGVGGHPAVERLAFGELEAGESAPAARVDTSALEPGWYRVSLQVLGFGHRGPADVSAQLEVVDAEEASDATAGAAGNADQPAAVPAGLARPVGEPGSGVG
jgi:hypothetical protein